MTWKREGNGIYSCKKCGERHRFSSKIGKRHEKWAYSPRHVLVQKYKG
jgi:ribosomal protein L37AE/L43A